MPGHIHANIRPTDELAEYFKRISHRLASLERSVNSGSDGGGGGGGTDVMPPAYAGPRRDGYPTYAQFSNTALNGGIGLTVAPDGEIQSVVMTGKKFTWYRMDAPGTTGVWIADIDQSRLQMGDICLGAHPAHNGQSIWPASGPAAGQYLLLRITDTTYVNGQSALHLRVNNAGKIAMTASQTIVYGALVQQGTQTVDLEGQVWSHSNFYCNSERGSDWSQAHVILQASNPRIAFNDTTIATQLRKHPADGAALSVVNSSNSLYAPIVASAFTVGSSATIKRDVRALRPEREHIKVHHGDPRSDLVAVPDIMALRPVAFRPRSEPTRVIAPDDPDDLEAWTSEPEPEHTWVGIDGRRERLGLIAEEVAETVPSAVTHNNDGGAVGIDYAQIVVALLDHVQELTRTIDTLTYRITELENPR